MKRFFQKSYHQQFAHLNNSEQNIEFTFGEKINYHQIGNACFPYEMTIEKDVAVVANRVLVDVNAIRLVNNAFAYCFEEARLSTPGGSNVEHNKYYGQVSTIMRALTSKLDVYYHILIKLKNLEMKLEKFH